MRTPLLIALAILVAGCSGPDARSSAPAAPGEPEAVAPEVAPEAVAPEIAPADAFMERLGTLCGQAFAGHVVTTDPADTTFSSQALVMHVRECGDGEIRIPFHVGENRSRTWILTRTASGLRLKHDHRHEDGSEDVLTMYGGDTRSAGSAARQEFPADEHSRALFVRENIPVSVDNVWAMEVEPGQIFVYELRRPNRHFRVEFDLRQPVDAPPAPWGAEP